MCPDSEILSAYFDKELPSPWKEKFERHLSACPECRAKLESYGSLSLALNPEEFDAVLNDASVNEAKERVWTKVSSSGPVRAARAAGEARRFTPRRTFAIPLPAAIAAMLFAALISVFVSGRLLNPPNQIETMAIGTDPQEPIPIADMNGVFKYLEQEDAPGSIVIMRLPESRNFKSAGEPTLIKAADYSKGKNTSR